MSNIVLNASTRSDMGKGASRRLRRDGFVPAIVYGGKREPVSITLEQRELQKEMKNEAFYSQILTVMLDGKKQEFVVKDLQRHPYKSIIMHLDLERVSQDKAIHVSIPLHYLNADSAKGVKGKGGVVSHHLIDLEITCLPKDLPEHLEIDLTDLDLDQTIHLSDLKLPKGVTSVALAHEDDKAVVSINLPKAAPIEDEGEVSAAPEASAEDKGTEEGGEAADEEKGSE